MPLVALAVREDDDFGKLIPVVNNVSIRPSVTAILSGAAHVKYTIASLPLFSGTVYRAVGSSTMYILAGQSGRSCASQDVSSLCIAATTISTGLGRAALSAFTFGGAANGGGEVSRPPRIVATKTRVKRVAAPATSRNRRQNLVAPYVAGDMGAYGWKF
jgi:hypothetical protein